MIFPAEISLARKSCSMEHPAEPDLAVRGVELAVAVYANSERGFT